MSSALTAPNRSGDAIKYHVPIYSVDTVTIKGGVSAARALVAGQVLGKITSGGKYIGLDLAASEGAGSDAAAGVLLEPVTAPDGVDVEASVVRRHAVVSKAALIWPDGISAGQISTALGELAALGIIARDAV